jgi:hypothetical protein
MTRSVKVGAIWTGLLVILLFALMISAWLRARAEAISCGNSMSSISLAVMLWTNDNEEIGKCPNSFVIMSNELNTPKILICPADSQRHAAANWSTLSDETCSYEIISPGLPATNRISPFFRCKVHRDHYGYTDGTVFDGKERRAKKFL